MLRSSALERMRDVMPNQNAIVGVFVRAIAEMFQSVEGMIWVVLAHCTSNVQ